MKLKTLALSVALLAVLSAIAFFANRPAAQPAADPRVGKPLLDPAVAASAVRLVVSDQGKTVTIERASDGTWRVPDYFNFPADFSKVSRFVSDLADSKVERFVSSNPATLARLGFKDTRLSLQDAAGKDLWSILLGADSDSGSGRYVRFWNEPSAFLCDLRAWIDNDPKAWADTQLVDLQPDAVASVRLSLEDGRLLTVSRTAKDAPWEAAGSDASRPVRSDAIASLLSTLGTLRYSDTTPIDDPAATEARKHPRTCTLTTFAGTAWTFDFGRKPEEKRPAPAPAGTAPKSPAPGTSTVAAAPADSTPPAAPTAASSDSGTIPAGPVFVFVASSDAKSPVNALMRQRSFEVDDATFTSLPNKEADVFDQKGP